MVSTSSDGASLGQCQHEAVQSQTSPCSCRNYAFSSAAAVLRHCSRQGQHRRLIPGALLHAWPAALICALCGAGPAQEYFNRLSTALKEAYAWLEDLGQHAAHGTAARLLGVMNRASALWAALMASLGEGSAGRWISCN